MRRAAVGIAGALQAVPKRQMALIVRHEVVCGQRVRDPSGEFSVRPGSDWNSAGEQLPVLTRLGVGLSEFASQRS